MISYDVPLLVRLRSAKGPYRRGKHSGHTPSCTDIARLPRTRRLQKSGCVSAGILDLRQHCRVQQRLVNIAVNAGLGATPAIPTSASGMPECAGWPRGLCYSERAFPSRLPGPLADEGVVPLTHSGARRYHAHTCRYGIRILPGVRPGRRARPRPVRRASLVRSRDRRDLPRRDRRLLLEPDARHRHHQRVAAASPGSRIDFVQRPRDRADDGSGSSSSCCARRRSTSSASSTRRSPTRPSDRSPPTSSSTASGIPVTLPVATDLKWKAYRFGYEWDFVYRDRGFVGVVLEAKYTDVEDDADRT